MAQFQGLYGREPPTTTRYILGSNASALVLTYFIQRYTVLALFKNNFLKPQETMMTFVDKHCTDLV